VGALLRIAAVPPGRADFSCTAGGRARAEAPVFQVRFKNRSTGRRYFSRVTSAPLATEAGPLPLTRFGNAGTRRPPAADAVRPALDPAVPGRISGLWATIFE
jgi:hypothetical protein